MSGLRILSRGGKSILGSSVVHEANAENQAETSGRIQEISHALSVLFFFFYHTWDLCVENEKPVCTRY